MWHFGDRKQRGPYIGILKAYYTHDLSTAVCKMTFHGAVILVMVSPTCSILPHRQIHCEFSNPAILFASSGWVWWNICWQGLTLPSVDKHLSPDCTKFITLMIIHYLNGGHADWKSHCKWKKKLPLKMGMMVKGNCVVVGLSNNQLVCMGYSST